MVADDDRLVSHAGLLVVETVAERLAVERALTAEVGLAFRTQPPGRTLVRLAETLIAGGDCVSDLAGLRDQPALWAEERVAHTTTAWRLVAERLVGPDEIVAPALAGVARARRTVRERAWRCGMRPQTVTIDIDAHLVTSHTDSKQAAWPTYKGGFGFCPMLAYLAETGEALAAILRPGSGSPMDATDQLETVDLALEQLPADVEPGAVLVRADGAAYAHEVVEGLLERGVCLLVGAKLQGPVSKAVLAVAEGDWQPIIEPDGRKRPDAWVAEARWPGHDGWPAELRLVVRREVPHVGAQLGLRDASGHRFVACLTNLANATPAEIERLGRGHAVVEDRIREARQLGLHNLPFKTFRANHAWLQIVLLAQDLVAWTHGLTRPGQTWMEPKTLRFCLVAVAGRITRHARQTLIHLPRPWPWSQTLIDAHERAKQIRVPQPA